MDAVGIIGEFDWQTKDWPVKEQIMMNTTPVVFAIMKKGSLYIHLMHSAAQFGGDPFCTAEYQEKILGCVGDRIVWIKQSAITIKDELWI